MRGRARGVGVGLRGFRRAHRPSPSASSPSAASTSARDAATSATPTRPVSRCTAPGVEPLPVTDLTGPTPADLVQVAELGSGPHGVVLLHQTDRVALCGWADFARWLAAGGAHVMVFDFCGYGRSVCPSEKFANDKVAQTTLVVGHLRSRGATRVTLVGASMGGSVAPDAAPASRADAVVDLSGPSVFPPHDAKVSLPKLTMATLLAVNDNDDPDAHRILQAGLASVPSPIKAFVSAPPGHGWDLVLERDRRTPTPLGRRIADWVAGTYR